MFRKLAMIMMFLLLLLNAPALFAQVANKGKVTVKGKVLDKKSGQPVSGATISIKGESNGVASGEDGNFTITVPSEKSILVISSVGFTTEELPVGISGQEMIIAITQKNKDLNEVVVTALGIQRSAKSLTYATQRISGDELNEIRDANIANTLSGKVAGLTITSSANGPGGAARIVLRGNRSIQGSNNALIVVDGVAIDNSTPSGQVRDDAGSSNGGQSGSDGISSINPDDIETINVLKGAAGAALYGSRASNGVILITTKRGRAGKIQVNVNSGISTESPMLLQDLQNEYSQGAGGKYSTMPSTNYGEKIAGQQVTDFHGNSVTLKAYPDNVRNFFRTGFSTNNSVSLSAGSEKMQTYISYANNYVNGIVPTNFLNRHNFNARLGVNITDRLSADARVTYVLQDISNKPGVGGDGLVGANVYRVPRSVNLDEYKDYKTVTGSVEKPYYWVSSDPVYTNPYWTVYNTHHYDDRSRVLGLISLRYKLTSWLNLQARVSSDSYNDFNTQSYANNTPNYARKPGGYYSEENAYVAERNIDVLLSGSNNIAKDLKITYNLGASDLVRNMRVRKSIADGLNITNKYDLRFATALTATTNNANRELQSVYGTAQFNLRDYLYLDLTARNDWSSTLPEPYSFFYPSVGLTAVLSDMFKMADWIDIAKVRASYAKVGNDADPYMINQTYKYIPGAYGGYIAASPTKAITDLKPELTSSFELGTEWRFLNNRVGFDLTVYKSNSRNQLIQINTPASSGYANTFLNAGNIQNSGLEIMLNIQPVRSKDFTWDLGLNYAYNKSKVVELDPSIRYVYLGSGSTFRTAIPVVREGGEYGDLYGYRWKRDASGQFIVNDNGLPVKLDTASRLGNYNPKYTFGFSNTFKYKNWSLGFLIDGKIGGVVASGTAGQYAYAGSSKSTLNYRDGNWVIPAVKADGSKNTTAVNAEQFWQTVASGDYNWGEFFTYDASNVRLREVSLGYEFKHLPAFLKAAKFSLFARNLFFLYRGSSIMDIPGIGKRKLDFDPEVSFGNSNYQGIEYYNLPSTRSIGINCKLTF
ncbi:SusC/RagA family TonB-linked outer membrane protein [Flavihumibacter profundi]|uniref:SusC/RagA family TonB-linked outer membrane protein n=1 Tax=Flavihumibacter profundi TaxID=2716883 RepID=UPI001CC67F7F|nr:SusC/RagA family TonB-linked outer membrane protein [Flavihumibacter profundi]MBZ5856878.1 SusC/RagA family TonB-linked outer membrane protein [Flavihumibacter profundi]